MQSPTGEERPPVPVMCCGAFQASERHFVWNEVSQAWGCALRGSQPLPEPPTAPQEPTEAAPAAPEPPKRPAARRTTTRKK